METQHLPEKARELLSKTVSGGTVNAPEALVQTVLQCVTEGKEGWSVDLPRLQRLLNNRAGIEQHERCGLIWDGRDEAEALTQRETYASLRPVPERSKNFETTRNLYIEGDNLEALKLLLPFYGGKVKMIYIDPPYNTGNDFLYKDDFRNVSYGHTTVRDADGLHENKAISGRYHSDWLSMMCPRLNLAKQFLSEDGVIFISIDDHEQARLKVLCDEIFGERNFIAIYKWNKTATPPALSDKVREKYEYVLCYEKKRSPIEYCGGIVTGGDMPLLNETNTEHELEFPSESVLFSFSGTFFKGQYDRVTLLDDIVVKDGRANRSVRLSGKFKWVQETVDKEIAEGTSFIVKSKKFAIRYCRVGERVKRPSDVISKEECGVGTNEEGAKDIIELFGTNVMSYPKPVSLIKYLIPFAETRKDSLVMDFFSGSATTAHAVMQLNAEDGGTRQFIMVQLPESVELGSAAAEAGFQNICEIGEERIRRAGEKILSVHPELRGKLDVGFRVLKIGTPLANSVCFKTPEGWAASDASVFDASPLSQDVTAEDLLMFALKEAQVALDAELRQETVAGLPVWSAYENGILRLVAYVQDVMNQIPVEQAKLIALAEALAERTVLPKAVFVPQWVFSDGSAAQQNFASVLKAHGMEFQTL